MQLQVQQSRRAQQSCAAAQKPVARAHSNATTERGQQHSHAACVVSALRTVVGSRSSAFIPAPHSASMRRMYALTAPFSPSLRAGVAIATLSSVTGRS